MQTGTIEKRFFLSVLADHLNRRKTPAPEGSLDWNAVLTLAEQHEVRGMVYHQCQAFLPELYRARFSQLYAAELYYYQNRLALFRDISSALTAANIPFFTVKGLDAAALYPLPALRTMGDCDIVVRPEDKERAHAVFLSLDFENEIKLDHEWTYFRQGLEFELHDHLLYDELGNTDSSRVFCERAWEHVKKEQDAFVLDWSFHYIFLLLHLHKHLIHSGVGFRQFMDLYVVAQTKSLNWSWMNSELEAMGLLDFSNRCSELTAAWFGGREMTERDRHCLDWVFGNGIFGFHDESNRENRRVDVMIKANRPLLISRLRQLRLSVFPTYENMRYVEYYSALDGRPWLLPAFWIYRWYRAVKYKMYDNGKRMVNDAMVSEKEIVERKKELSFWGL